MLYHELLGNRGPILIGLHGLATAHRLLSLRLAPLADSSRLYFPDLLGHGQSPWPECAYGVREHLDAFQEWRAAVGLAREPVYLFGVSLGAILALHYAANEQDWYGTSTVRGVMPISSPAYPNLAVGRAWVGRTSPVAYLMVHHPPLAARLCRLLCGVGGLGWTYGPRLAPWLPPDVVEDTFAHCWQSLIGTFERVVLDPHLPDALAKLTDQPVLFVHGDRDRLAPFRHLRAALAGHPTARLRVLPGADHDAIATRTAAIVAALRGFMSRSHSPPPSEASGSARARPGPG